MKWNYKKYQVSRHGKKIWLLSILVFLQLPAFAQDETTGKKNILKYELDTTIVEERVEELVPEEQYQETGEEDKKDPEYFLRKEFNGGLPDTMQLRKLPENAMKAIREDNAFWYANEVFKKKPEKKRTSFTAHPLFQTILWLIIIGGFAAFIILYLYNSNVQIFRRSRNIAVEEGDTETNDIFAINYQREIDKAIGMNNYRLAVRLMFLRLLKNLSDRNIIQYKQDSTNFDYLLQLHQTRMYPEFFRLTRNYEYSWYGQFDIDKEKFVVIKNEFENFDRKLK